MLKRNFPAGEDEYGRMAIECSRESLSTLDAQIDPAVLNSRDGRLWDACEFGKLALAQLLEFAKYPHGLTN